MPATPAWLAAVEVLINRGMRDSARASALARRLDGTALLVEVEGFAAVRASIVGTRLALETASGSSDRAATSSDLGTSARASDGVHAPAANATIAGSPLALLGLARSGSVRSSARTPPGAPARAAAQIRGDAEIADLYRQLFASSAPDLEDEVARIIGDLPARRLAQFAQRAADWTRGARRAAGENVAEYLQEEGRDLVNKPELDEFLHGVDALREAADRVEARLALLERRLKGSA